MGLLAHELFITMDPFRTSLSKPFAVIYWVGYNNRDRYGVPFLPLVEHSILLSYFTITKYQNTTKYTKCSQNTYTTWPSNVPNFPLQGLQKCIKIGILE
jgi:hypothetical protein